MKIAKCKLQIVSAVLLLCVLCGEGFAVNKNPHAIVEIDGFRWSSVDHPRLFQRVSVELSTGEASGAVWEIFDPKFVVINHYSTADGIPEATVCVWLRPEKPALWGH